MLPVWERVLFGVVSLAIGVASCSDNPGTDGGAGGQAAGAAGMVNDTGGAGGLVDGGSIGSPADGGGSDVQGGEGGTAAVIPRVVFFATEWGTWDAGFRLRFAGIADDEKNGWTASLSADSPWTSSMAPLAALAHKALIVEGMWVHADATDALNGSPVLTGIGATTVVGQPAHFPVARAPSLDWMIAASQPTGKRGVTVIGSGQGEWALSFPDSGLRPAQMQTPAAIAAQGAMAKDCAFQPSADVVNAWKRKPSSRAEADLVAADLAYLLGCDVSRVVTAFSHVSDYREVSYNGDFHQNIIDGFNDYLRVGGVPTPPQHAIDALNNYYTLMVGNLVTLAKALNEIPGPHGTLLDETMIVWVSGEPEPSHQPGPWHMNTVILGGAALGVPQGRYVRLPQTTQVRTTYISNEPRVLAVGPPHNHLLVNIARWAGLNVDFVGRANFDGGAGVIDTTGGLPLF